MAATTAAVVTARPILLAQAGNRTRRAPYRLIYSNDTTNITTCASPFYKPGQPFNATMLYSSMNEVNGLGVDAHFLQPGLCGVPWWKSKLYPTAEHYRWMKDTYGVSPDPIGQYVLNGGDVVQEFVNHCERVSQAAFISFRLNDSHHKEWIDGRPGDHGDNGLAMGVSRFYHDHPEYRIGPDKNDWAQRVLNWAIPEVRAERLGMIRELCENYEFAGLELDFMRYFSYFQTDRTTSAERSQIMTAFVREVRGVLDANMKRGRRRWLCVRVPAFVSAFDGLGIDLPAMVEAGVDMVNLSSSYFTTQQGTDLAAIRKLVPSAALFNEMTNVTWVGKKNGPGYDNRLDRRTTAEQFRTTANLAYERGADGMSLFNFAYYRPYGGESRGPGAESPFEVLPSLKDKEWLSRRPQHYFRTSGWKGPHVVQSLPRHCAAGGGEKFEFDLALPPNRDLRTSRMRIQSDSSLEGSEWTARWNSRELKPSPEIGEPFDAPYPQLLGKPAQLRAWAIPQEWLRPGSNTLEITLVTGAPRTVEYIDIALV
ncbi:MAG: hypothetical protein WDM96_17050 [Lacunisphaera sp.]